MSARQVGVAASRPTDLVTLAEVQALIAAAGGGGGADVSQRPPNPAPPIGSWLWTPSVTVGGIQPPNGEMALHPMWLPPGTYDALAWSVANAGSAGALTKAVVYGDSGGAPSGLLVDAAAVATDTTSGTYQVTGLNLVSPAAGRMVWAAVINQGNPTTRPNLYGISRVGNAQPMPASALGLQFASGLPMAYLVNGVTGAAPATPSLVLAQTAVVRVLFRRSA